MDLKFTLGGASPARGRSDHGRGHDDHGHDGHDHGDHGRAGLAPGSAGIPLPFAGAAAGGTVSTSSALDLSVAFDEAAGMMSCEALSGDGVLYARSEKPVQGRDVPALAAAARSVLARTGAGLPEPLLGSVTGIVLALGGAESAVLAEFGIALGNGEDLVAVDEALQARTGISAGIPIRLAD